MHGRNCEHSKCMEQEKIFANHIMNKGLMSWSPGKGNGKPLYYSCLEKLMSSMKKQKYGLMDKDNVVYMYIQWNISQNFKRKEFRPLTLWIYLKDMILSEISLKQKGNSARCH